MTEIGKNKGTYIRIGASNRKAGYENILELERQRRNISYDEVKEARTRRILKGMVDKGILGKRGRGRNTCYELRSVM